MLHAPIEWISHREDVHGVLMHVSLQIQQHSPYGIYTITKVVIQAKGEGCIGRGTWALYTSGSSSFHNSLL